MCAFAYSEGIWCPVYFAYSILDLRCRYLVIHQTGLDILLSQPSNIIFSLIGNYPMKQSCLPKLIRTGEI